MYKDLFILHSLNKIATDGMTMQGARASAAAILT